MQTNIFDATPDTCAEAVEWICANSAAEPELEKLGNSLITKLCRLSYHADSANEVLASERTTIGVFGASQAGKSYLVSNLAAPGKDLVASWDGKEISFLKYINPPGGDIEATGIVTRFTHRKNTGAPGYPIELRVFREVEIVMMLVNSFFKDFTFNADTIPTVEKDFAPDKLEAVYKEAEKYKAEGPVYVTKADVIYLADYVKGVAQNVSLQEDAAESAFWAKMRELLPTLNLKGRTLLYELLWGKLQMFSIMFGRIAAELEKLEGRDLVYAKLDAFVDIKDGEMTQRDGGNIVNISALSKLMGEKEDHSELTVRLSHDEDRTATVNFSRFAAATVELLFPLEDGTPLDNFDVLDFPGARSRRKDQIQDFRNDELNNYKKGEPTAYMIENSSEFIRRGKVGYLIERYGQRRETDVLLFCIAASKQVEVSDLVNIINDWLKENGCEHAADRANITKIPLVGVLTRCDEAIGKCFNTQAKVEKPGADMMGMVFEHFKSSRWLTDWTDGTPLKTFFMVRKPHLDVGENSAWLSFENGRETGIRGEAEATLEAFKQNVSASEHFKSHFYGDLKAIEEMMRVGDGGVSYISDYLVSTFGSDSGSRERVYKAVRAELKNADAALEVFANRSADSARCRKEGAALGKKLLEIDGISHIFGDMRRLMEIDDGELKDLYLDHYTSGNNAERFATDVMKAYKARLNDLNDGAAFRELHALLERAYMPQCENLAAQPDCRETYSFFYNEQTGTLFKTREELKDAFKILMQKYVGELLKAASCREISLREKLVAALHGEESVGTAKDELVTGQVKRVQRLLSDFHTYLSAMGGASSADPVFRPDKDQEGNPVERRAFHETFAESYGLPRITQELFESYSRHFRQDYVTELVHLMAGANTQTESKYKFSAKENARLCSILDRLEQGLSE